MKLSASHSVVCVSFSCYWLSLYRCQCICNTSV